MTIENARPWNLRWSGYCAAAWCALWTAEYALAISLHWDMGSAAWFVVNFPATIVYYLLAIVILGAVGSAGDTSWWGMVAVGAASLVQGFLLVALWRSVYGWRIRRRNTTS